jgi:hypothetical protein
VWQLPRRLRRLAKEASGRLRLALPCTRREGVPQVVRPRRSRPSRSSLATAASTVTYLLPIVAVVLGTVVALHPGRKGAPEATKAVIRNVHQGRERSIRSGRLR